MTKGYLKSKIINITGVIDPYHETTKEYIENIKKDLMKLHLFIV